MTQSAIEIKPDTLGDRIRAARKEAQPRVTIATIARELEVDPRTVARWQADGSVPSIANLAKIAALVGKPVTYFLDGVEITA